MPKRTNQFQDIVSDLYRTLAPEGAEFEESAMVAEPDGTRREVDILIRTKVAGSDLSLAVECRDYSRAQSVEWIDSLIGKYQNLPIDKVLAVSSSGFTAASTLKAARHRMHCLAADDAADVDWAAEFTKPWKSLHYTLQICHVAAQTKDGTNVSHTEITEDNRLIHDDLLSERLYPTLYKGITDNWLDRIKDEHDKAVVKYWDQIGDGGQRYAEFLFDGDYSIFMPERVIKFDQVLVGVLANLVWKEIEPYSRVLQDRVATSIVDGDNRLTIINTRGGDHAGTIFRTENKRDI
ncbi:restriction endonuclease [Sphingomonas sp. XXL09]|uniref:restriction endonuclease n=1 Tax=Sphingomonas sp. XXL09 TaxID=3457787 RepID=UPI00406BAEEC